MNILIYLISLTLFWHKYLFLTDHWIGLYLFSLLFFSFFLCLALFFVTHVDCWIANCYSQGRVYAPKPKPSLTANKNRICSQVSNILNRIMIYKVLNKQHCLGIWNTGNLNFLPLLQVFGQLPSLSIAHHCMHTLRCPSS